MSASQHRKNFDMLGKKVKCIVEEVEIELVVY
jgi:hypothetical protein